LPKTLFPHLPALLAPPLSRAPITVVASALLPPGALYVAPRPPRWGRRGRPPPVLRALAPQPIAHPRPPPPPPRRRWLAGGGSCRAIGRRKRGCSDCGAAAAACRRAPPPSLLTTCPSSSNQSIA